MEIMLRKKALHDKAISLRKKGLSYNEILGIVHVGHGTISRWCRNIELTEKQKNRIKEKQVNNSLIRNLKELSLKNKKNDKRWAVEEIKNFKMDRNELLFSGILLYWAEGFNSSTGQNAVFTNTDPEMVRIMMRFFREILFVDERKIRVMVRIGEKGNLEKAKNYWSEITGLPLGRFQNAEILKLKENSKSLERYPNGMCRVSVYDVTVRRKINNYIELLKDRIRPRSSTGQSLRFLNLR